jgi:antitoxin (DNA-binding transcriptional repressor) of toxin-antitoxin stability system
LPYAPATTIGVIILRRNCGDRSAATSAFAQSRWFTKIVRFDGTVAGNHGPFIVDHSNRGVSVSTKDNDEVSIGMTAFKARCLGLVDQVVRGKKRRIVLMKRNRPVAAIVPLGGTPAELWGALRGTVRVAPGTDLTGTGETWDADR